MLTDCRGTSCRQLRIEGWSPPILHYNLIRQLIYPNHPLHSLQALHNQYQSLFPDPYTFPYALCVEGVDHPADPRQIQRNKLRAGEAQDSDLAILPSNSLKPVVITRAPYDEDETVIRTSAPETKKDNKLWLARHQRHWRPALLEDADDCFGGEWPAEASVSQENSEASEAEDSASPSPSRSPTPVEADIPLMHVSISCAITACSYGLIECGQ